MKIKRKIAVVTGTRAEFGILRPLIEKIHNSSELDLQLIVTGMHLLEEYGLTINDIKDSRFNITSIVPMYYGNSEDLDYHGKGLGRGISNFTTILINTAPDILVVLGDRLEGSSATYSAAILGIAVAHISGGDKTDSGHIDESIRHSMTKFSHIHFPSTRQSAERIIRMGEEPWRVFTVGALALDSILHTKPIPKKELMEKLGIDAEKEIIVCVFHPVHLDKGLIKKQVREILEAINELGIQTIIIYPNNDVGSQDIIDEIGGEYDSPFIKTRSNLPHPDYISLLRYADVLVGNSSSGIVEAPSLNLPVVNIGTRNVGREHADNIIFVDFKKNEIVEGIKTALYDENFKNRVNESVSPYGDGKTSDRILKILTEIEIDKRLLTKKNTY